MNIYSALPYFLIMALIFLSYQAPIFRFLDETPQGVSHRFHSLDGLRGVLALSVVAHHVAINYVYQKSGIWELPDSRFYSLLGQVGVSIFFMITAFLFTGKLLSDKPVRWASLYIGRIFRIGPLYLAAVLVMLVIVLFRTNFEIYHVTQTIKEIGVWLALGISGARPDVNGYLNTRYILAGVTWSIHYEWMFYFSLILMRPFRKYKRLFSVALLLISLASLQLTGKDSAAYAALFAVGIFTRAWVRMPQESGVSLRNQLGLSLGALAALIAMFCFCKTAYAALPIVLLGIFFFGVASGATLFGLLALRSSHRLGNTSYGIYLLQGLPITLVFSVPGLRAWALTGSERYWAVGAVCVACLLVASIVGYAAVEKPGIAIGRAIARRIQIKVDERFVRGRKAAV